MAGANASGPNAVISGAGHGLGAALARRLARSGHGVVLLDLDGEAARRGADALEAEGLRATGLACDVTDLAACEAVAARVLESFGGVDLLVNNAGITHVGRFGETDPAVLRRVMEVNYFGAVHCTKVLLPSLLARCGQVAVISSVAGFAPLATRAGYVASKHAVQGFFETLRAEYGREGLGVTLVCPSFVRTGIGTRALGPNGQPAAPDARRGVAHELGPEEAAERIVRGIERRKRLVWVGREARLAWWLTRIWPAAYERLMLRRTLP